LNRFFNFNFAFIHRHYAEAARPCPMTMDDCKIEVEKTVQRCGI
jgi:hypothetical protein